MKRLAGQVVNNIQPGVEVGFARLGYFHSAAEIVQVIKFIRNPNYLPLSLRQYIFRVEPRPTTPLNEFDSGFEMAIREGREYAMNLRLDDLNWLIMEISSLSVNLHVPAARALHTNPNIPKNVPYSDIYPEGYYAKFAPELMVQRIETDLGGMISQLQEVQALLPQARVLVLGHLRSPTKPNPVRDRVHALLLEACSKTGCEYFDTAPFLDEYGYASNQGVQDIHHLADEGERAIGVAMQRRISPAQ